MNSNALTNVKAGITAILAALTAFWGWFGWLVLVWVGMMLLDWLVGSAAAAKQGKWSSEKLRAGAWHKGGEVVIVIVALVADWLIGLIVANFPGITLPFQYTVLLAPLVIVWYIIGELGSLAEHAVTFGAPVPEWLVSALEAGKKAVDSAGDKLTGSEEGDGQGDK
ncbi:putative holin [Oscillibacter valericigenes Sjm18-20]|nr:putative holin [Oscillibacter valericigenes Sjm18-20]